MPSTSRVRVLRLDLSVLALPDWHPEAAGGAASPVYGYVIDHPDGAIVVDTGVGFGNDFIDQVYEPRSQQLGDALTVAGVDPTSVVAVVNSHLHFDHCGQNPMFYGSKEPCRRRGDPTSTGPLQGAAEEEPPARPGPARADPGIPFFVQSAELEAVGADRFYTDPEWALPPLPQRRLLDGDETIAEGVTILATPGHTVGHQSVLIETDGERVVIAAQAVWHSSEVVSEEPRDSNIGSPELRATAAESIRRLKALRPRVIHFSHCDALRFEAPPA